MSEQSEFEKFREKVLEDIVSGDFSDGLCIGMDKARDWILKRLLEEIGDEYDLVKIREICK